MDRGAGAAGYRRLLSRSVLWAASRIDPCRIDLRHTEDATIADVQVVDAATAGEKGVQGVLIHEGGSAATPLRRDRRRPVSCGVRRARGGLSAPCDRRRRAAAVCGQARIAGSSHPDGVNHALLQQLAADCGGRYNVLPAEMFRRGRTELPLDLTPWLLGAAACLFFAEIVVKRAGAVRRLLWGAT